MKQKVGILTTYFASNYGAMLQPFALKRYLELLGYDVEMIRYEQKYISHYYNPWKPEKLLSPNPLRNLAYLIELPGMLLREMRFKKYMYRHINNTKGFVKEIPQDKDYYFIGSDQIWNPKNTNGFDDVYFGDFPTKQDSIKASYAASAETITYSKDQEDYLRKNIKNFNYVSVREASLADNIKKVTGRDDIFTVLDPTMLVDPNVYDEIKATNPYPQGKFVFFYSIRNCTPFLDKIRDYAVSINAKLVIVTAMPDRMYLKYAIKNTAVKYLPYAGIDIFLGGMKYADCVFTASFHGSVFAILNKKRFYTLQLNDDCMTRPTHLLTMLGIPDRLLSIDDTITEDVINYDSVNKLLDEQRSFSKNYVLKVLNKE